MSKFDTIVNVIEKIIINKNDFIGIKIMIQ